MSDISTLSQEQIKALLAELPADALRAAVADKVSAEKAETDARNAGLIALGSDLWETVLVEVPVKVTESTGRVGRDVMTARWVGQDGVERTISLHITDVGPTAEGRARVKAEKEAKEAAEKAAAKAAPYAGVSLTKTP